MNAEIHEVVEWLYEMAKKGEWVLVLNAFEKMPKTAAICSRYCKSTSGWGFLHQAAYFGNEVAARELIRLGARINAQTNENETPIQIAEKRGHAELARVLTRASYAGVGVWQPVDDPEFLPSSNAWKEAIEKKAAHELRVAYAGGVVTIPKGSQYFVDSFARILVGWHGTYNPPRGMDGRPMF